jgi:DNA invertase Pin-like site-specific DNA recombinase
MTNGQKRRAKLTTAATSAVIYLRVSTQRQADSGAGLDAQLAKCQEHCFRQGLPVLSVHKDEAISGKDGVEKRPGLRDAIAAVTAVPGAVVVVYSLSRLGRSQRLIWNLLDAGGEYALPLMSATEPFETTTPMGRAMLGMLGVWAQLESDLVSERTIDALAAVALRGTKLGAPGMASSRRVNGVLQPRVDVDAIKALYLSGGYSYRTLAEHLNETGVPTATGTGKWHVNTVRTALATKA